MRDGKLPFRARAMLGALRKDFGREQLGDTEELELYRVTTAIGCDVDESERTREVLTVIA